MLNSIYSKFEHIPLTNNLAISCYTSVVLEVVPSVDWHRTKYGDVKSDVFRNGCTLRIMVHLYNRGFQLDVLSQ